METVACVSHQVRIACLDGAVEASLGDSGRSWGFEPFAFHAAPCAVAAQVLPEPLQPFWHARMICLEACSARTETPGSESVIVNHAYSFL